jgi:hypothetical protein
MSHTTEEEFQELKAQNELLIDALDHINRTTKGSRTQTRRLRWISLRAESAINGDDKWRESDLPKKAKLSLRESKMQTFIDKNLQQESVNLVA